MRASLGSQAGGIYAGGSWALGDYVQGRSDLDVAVVTAGPLGDREGERLVGAVRHESLACPARGLELVVYSEATARAGRIEPGFELNLNTGPAMATRVERRGATDEPHWYAIDRAILASRGVALGGPPPTAVFEAAPRDQLLVLLATSLRWRREHGASPAEQVLSACRSLRYAREGVWSSKSEAASWMLTQPAANVAVGQALAIRRGEGEVEPAATAALVTAVLRALGTSHPG